MRNDIHKLLVERPRTGSGTAWKYESEKRKTRHFSIDELPAHESMRDIRNRPNNKYSSENLRPLYRYFAKSVGRSWNDVYSELCEHLNRNSTIQAHIFQHIKDFVELCPRIIDGKAYWATNKYTNDREITRDLFYVDADGILRRGAGATYKDIERARGASAKPGFLRLSNTKVAKRDDNGVWYEVTLAPFVADGPDDVARDAWRAKDVSREWADVCAPEEYGQKGVYAVRKRQMNTREIRALNK
jgi:hypothetical protein